MKKLVCKLQERRERQDQEALRESREVDTINKHLRSLGARVSLVRDRGVGAEKVLSLDLSQVGKRVEEAITATYGVGSEVDLPDLRKFEVVVYFSE